MFGLVSANLTELSKDQRRRYGSVYCGICRAIRRRCSQTARLTLSYDMAFLALLLMSLYEPQECSGRNHCMVHPLTRRDWLENGCIDYAADMNVLLAYHKALDDWADESRHTARLMAQVLEAPARRISADYPRQAQSIRDCLEELARLERENCPNPDLPAASFGALMAQLLVWKQDQWTPALEGMGDSLGRFLYLADAAQDYDRDLKKGCYNPFLAMGSGKNPGQWREYLVLTMARCTDFYERLPLVQDKAILDNILYSGIWTRQKRRKEEGTAP